MNAISTRDNGKRAPSTDDETAENSTRQKKKRPAPIAGVRVPDIGTGEGAWRRAVVQWEEGDPSRGLDIALKNWPREWYTGDMREVTAAKRGQRELIAKEYQQCVPFSEHISAKPGNDSLSALEGPMRHS